DPGAAHEPRGIREAHGVRAEQMAEGREGRQHQAGVTGTMPKFRFVAATAALLIAVPVFAQSTYPTKPIRILVPLIPGGLTDLMSRVIGQKLTEAWGQPAIVDNRPGASGMIASDIVAKAAPDGHTLITVSLAHAVNASIYPKLPYDTVRDFTPVIYVADTPQIPLVRPQVQ